MSSALHHEPPNPNNVKLEDKTPHQFATHMLMQFGHFLGHDITLTPQDELDCCHPNIVRLGEANPAPDETEDVFQRSRLLTLSRDASTLTSRRTSSTASLAGSVTPSPGPTAGATRRT